MGFIVYHSFSTVAGVCVYHWKSIENEAKPTPTLQWGRSVQHHEKNKWIFMTFQKPVNNQWISMAFSKTFETPMDLYDFFKNL